MKKSNTLIILGVMILVLSGLIVSAACCERLPNDGLWCVAADSIDECDQDYGYRSDLQTCETYVKCHGTCVNENTGECGQAPELECVEDGGNWYQESEDQLPACQQGCCVAGENAYFINAVECKDFATSFGIDTDFRPDLTSRDECAALITATVTGACVVSTEIQDVCVITTNTECVENNAEFLANKLGISVILSNLEIDFYEGLLCTAPGISDCAKSEITECKDNKVYYKDTCGNFANVYDSTQYGNAEYWTFMREPYDENVCTVSSEGSSTCGNCETTQNTVCRDQGDTNEGNPDYGEYVCGDLGCDYEGTAYQHGESWCAGTNGALARYILDGSGVSDRGESHRILTDGFTGEMMPETAELLKDQDTYNTPGSKYFKLICSFGEVLIEECKEYRNSVCTEFVQQEENAPNQAACAFNSWRRCFEMTTKEQCNETTEMCKWVPGHRWDFMMVPEEERSSHQGSCVPLVSPGFDFWKGTSQGVGLCQMATVQENTLYETGIFVDRDYFHSADKERMANRCFDKCYAIPQYGEEFNDGLEDGKVYPEEIELSDGRNADLSYGLLTEFYDESNFRLPNDVDSYHLSDRQGQYCHRYEEPDRWLTGQVWENAYDCGVGAREKEKERDYPIYLTHQEWLDGITERARSIGDCGYKPNLEGTYSSDETEIITAIFQVLRQDGDIRRNATGEQIIYKAGVKIDWLPFIESPVQAEVYGGCSEQGGVCTVEGAQYCTGGTVLEGEGICPLHMACCVYEELGGGE